MTMNDGQIDAEGGALPHRAFDFDAAFVVLDDLFADGEAQAGAFGFAFFGGALGGEEGLEDLADHFFGDSGAGIDHLDADFFGSFGDGGLDGQRAGAAAQHGVARPDAEGDEDGRPVAP